MLPFSSQLVIIQAKSELQSTAQPPSHAPSACNSSHSLRLPTYPPVSTINSPGKPDGQEAGSSQVSGSKFTGSMGGQHPSFTKMCGGTITDDVAVSHDAVFPFSAVQIQPLLQNSSQQVSCQQCSSQDQSCQQGLSQQLSAQQRSLHQQPSQVKLSETSSSGIPLMVDTTQSVCPQQDADQGEHCLQRSSCDDLVFTLQSEDDEEGIDAQRAITSLAQVGCSDG